MTLNSNKNKYFMNSSDYWGFPHLITAKFSLLKILLYGLPLVLFNGIIFTLYTINKQISENTQAIIALKNENILLSEMLTEKQQKLDALKERLSALQDKNQVLENLLLERDIKLFEGSQINNADILIANNEMVQFWVKVGGGILLGAFVVYTAYSMFPTFFSAKALMPSSIYKFVQDYTPFFQEKRSFLFTDNQSSTNWCINVINDKCIGINVKPFNSNDFVPISEYIMKLNSDAGTMVAAKAETLSSAASLTVSAVPPSAEATAAAVATAISLI